MEGEGPKKWAFAFLVCDEGLKFPVSLIGGFHRESSSSEQRRSGQYNMRGNGGQ